MFVYIYIYISDTYRKRERWKILSHKDSPRNDNNEKAQQIGFTNQRIGYIRISNEKHNF